MSMHSIMIFMRDVFNHLKNHKLPLNLAYNSLKNIIERGRQVLWREPCGICTHVIYIKRATHRLSPGAWRDTKTIPGAPAEAAEAASAFVAKFYFKYGYGVLHFLHKRPVGAVICRPYRRPEVKKPPSFRYTPPSERKWAKVPLWIWLWVADLKQILWLQNFLDFWQRKPIPLLKIFRIFIYQAQR